MKTVTHTLGARTISRNAFIAAIALLVAAAGATLAAANRFAVVGIENGTHVTIRLQHKWGDGTWMTDVLRPGGRKWFWHEYSRANENRSPKFHVRFDSDLNPGDVFHINYALEKRAAPAHDWEDANKYVFRYDGNRKYIDLVKVP